MHSAPLFTNFNSSTLCRIWRFSNTRALTKLEAFNALWVFVEVFPTSALR